MNRKEIQQIERVLSAGTWVIVFGAVVFSVLTVTPLVASVTHEDWRWTAPILPIVVDAAVVIVVRLDGAMARLRAHGGGWPILLRWLTGVMTLALNTGSSALKGDWVGVAVHAVAPLLLIVTAEAGLAYRKAIAAALERREAEDREREERAARERKEREVREREERAARERAAQEERERQEEREERRERAAREHEAAQEAARHDRAAAERREREERADALRREEAQKRLAAEREATERAARERKEREDRERKEREERAARERAAQKPVSVPRERPARPSVSTRKAAPKAAPVSAAKLSEEDARAAVERGVRDGVSTRQIAAETGWSAGWVATRAREARELVSAS